LSRELLIKVFAVDTGTVYVVGNRKTFLKYTSAGGVEETMNDAPSDGCRRGQRGMVNGRPTIVRGVLMLGAVGSRQNTAYRAELLDISGRKVMELVAGDNDLSRLAPGVYFVRGGSSRVRKVVVTR
jgi:hypothetical protein